MNQPNKETQKWFYPAQKEAMQQLHARFNHVSCDFQMFSDNRVCEQYSYYHETNGLTNVEVVYRKYESTDRVTIIIYELKYLQGWQREIK